MADLKISELTNLTAADPANDMIPIVDVSATPPASGSTKRISINNILACSPTATLASATISGDLTVDTSTLKVDSANNRVGVGTASPAETLTVAGKIRSVSSTFGLSDIIAETTAGTGTGYARLIVKTADREWRLINDASTSGSPFIIYDATANAESLRIATAGVYTFGDGAGGTRMTLNATGLGVGGAPLSGFRLNVNNGDFRVSDVQNEDGVEIGWSAGAGSGFVQVYNRTTSVFKDLVLNNAVTINTSGNVGIGVTPSAWSSSYKAIQIGTVGSLSSGSSSTFGAIFASNMYQAAGGATYIANGYASRYDVRTDNGNHVWYISSNNTLGANQPLSFNTAMTLESTGSLVLGDAAVATTATNGFLYIPGCAGTPTGTPTAKTGRVPLVVDTTNNKLYFYSGGAWVAAN